jgi:hypothetical protein
VHFVEDKMVGGAKEAELALFKRLTSTYEKHMLWNILQYTFTGARDCGDSVKPEMKCFLNTSKTLNQIIGDMVNKGVKSNRSVDDLYSKATDDKSNDSRAAYIRAAVKFILNTPIIDPPVDEKEYTLYVAGDGDLKAYTIAASESTDVTSDKTVKEESTQGFTSISNEAGGVETDLKTTVISTPETRLAHAAGGSDK